MERQHEQKYGLNAFLLAGRLDKMVPEGLPPSAPAAIRGCPRGLLSPGNSLLVRAMPHSMQHAHFPAVSL